MKWVKSSVYSIKTSDGRFHIARAVCSGVDKFTLWDGHQIVGTWLSPDEAKQAAIEISGSNKFVDAVYSSIEQPRSRSNDESNTYAYTDA